MNIKTPRIKITNPGEIAGVLAKVLNAEDENDLEITRRLVKAGQILNIKLLDHIIITLEGKYYSFADNNLIKKEI